MKFNNETLKEAVIQCLSSEEIKNLNLAKAEKPFVEIP